MAAGPMWCLMRVPWMRVSKWLPSSPGHASVSSTSPRGPSSTRLAGEITFKIGDEVTVGGPGTCAFFPRNVPHAWKNTGRETGRVLFLYTPATAGGYVEELLNRPGPMNTDEGEKLRERYRWEVVGPNPL